MYFCAKFDVGALFLKEGTNKKFDQSLDRYQKSLIIIVLLFNQIFVKKTNIQEAFSSTTLDETVSLTLSA